MAVFAFYNFKLSEPSLKNETFSAFAPESKLDLKVVQQKKDGSYDDEKVAPKIYNNDVLANHDGILVMTLENNKQKATTIDKQKVEHEHHPFCHVIIDYRDGHNLIAIERNAAFDNKPEKVRNLLAHTLNRILYRNHLTIELTPLSKAYNDIWDAINTIRYRHNDRVKRIAMDFNGNHHTNRQVQASALASIIAEISDKLNAKGLVAFQSEGTEEMDLNAIHEDLLNLAEICVNEGEYDLSIHFFSYGIFRYGSDVVAQYGIEQPIIDDFVCPPDDFDADRERDTLPVWLTKMKEMFNDYDAPTPASVEPKRGHRR